MKKYEMTEETRTVNGRTLHRIRALKSFGNVSDGDLGGWIEKEQNLSQIGNAWVSDNARVYDNAWVSGDACVSGSARVSGDARVDSTNQYLTVGPIGRRNDTTTFFNNKDGKISVSYGCFLGEIDEFEAAVRKTHGENKHGQAYRLAIQLAKAQVMTKAVKEGK